MGAFFSFLRDVIADLKTSWRFRVACVIWIPLIVCAGILVVRFGIIHTLSQKYRQFQTTFVPQSSVAYPNIEIYWSNAPTSGSICYQPNTTNGNLIGTLCPDTQQTRNNNQCIKYGLSRFSTTQNPNHPLGYPIHCDFQFNAKTNPDGSVANQEFFMLFPGGWNTSSAWDYNNPVPLRPNVRIGMQLFHEVFLGYGGRVDNWFSNHIYEETIFPNGQWAYNVSIHFWVPFDVVQVNWEEDGFDSWLLLAFWGGGFFFFYVLFLLAFNIAKFFLPDDSRLLKTPTEGPSTQPLMS